MNGSVGESWNGSRGGLNRLVLRVGYFVGIPSVCLLDAFIFPLFSLSVNCTIHISFSMSIAPRLKDIVAVATVDYSIGNSRLSGYLRGLSASTMFKEDPIDAQEK